MSLPGRGSTWQSGEVAQRMQAFGNAELANVPGAVLEFPGSRDSDAGRLFVVRPPALGRIGNFFNILGEVVPQATGGRPGSPWGIDTAVRRFAFTATTATGTLGLALADSFIPGFAEARMFVQMGGHHWVASAIRGLLTPPVPPPAPPPAVPPAGGATTPGMGSRILGSIGEGLAFLGGSFVSFPLFFIPKGGFTKGGFTGQTVPDS